VRIYLAGRLVIEVESRILDEEELPARQGRIAFAYMVLNRGRPIPRLELATAIWGDSPPDAWEASLSALLSRMRNLFRTMRLDAEISALSGSVHFSLPPDHWVDIEAARSALDEAEGLLRAGKFPEAWPRASVATSIFERGFLQGEEHQWIVRERRRIEDEHLRSLELLSDVTLALGEPTAALRYAKQCSDLEPFRESAYEREMRAQLQLGNRAEALRTYERLRTLLQEQLGADPSPALQAAFLEALQA
jgi:DNA-binding SARP family transcriptional activator